MRHHLTCLLMLNLAPVTPAGRLRLAVEEESFRGPDRTQRRLDS